MKIDDVVRLLDEIEQEDVDPHTGKLFAYVYETGDENIRKVANEALLRFAEKNILDFTVFRSAMHFEREVVGFAKKLMHGGDTVVGSYTFGGTESIMLAVKAARDYYRKKTGKDVVPEIVAPVTIHPAFCKAADYLGLKMTRVGIDDRTKVDVDALNEAVSGKTAMIALSTPNWPFGTIDPVEEVAEIAQDGKTLLHVDACLGGFILPFFEMLGENLPRFDFRVEGVTSISLDVHKYGYAPKGSSVVLFRDSELKKHSMYVDVSSPGYVFVNQAVLSSRPVGPLAAAFAVIKYLEVDGYRRLASKVLSARNRIYSGLKKLGFESVGPVESCVLSMHSDIDLLGFVNNMKSFGWHLHLQKGLEKYGVPDNIHMTLSPIHDELVDEFLADAEKAIGMKSEVDGQYLKSLVESGDFARIIEDLNSGKLSSSVIPMLLESIPEEVAVEMIKEIVIQWYR